MIFLNSSNIQDIYYNSFPIGSAYWGKVLVWQKDSASGFWILSSNNFKNLLIDNKLKYNWYYDQRILVLQINNKYNNVTQYSLSTNIQDNVFAKVNNNNSILIKADYKKDIYLNGDLSNLFYTSEPFNDFLFLLPRNINNCFNINFDYAQNLANFVNNKNISICSYHYHPNGRFNFIKYFDLQFDCGENVINMTAAYGNQKNIIKAKNLCGSNVIDMSLAYSNCQNLISNPVCGSNVINMSSTYLNCQNLIGTPVCSSNVINMSSAYYNCTNLTGNPVCGLSVIDMSSTYYNCTNLTGSPVCGPNVINMRMAYYNCTNLTNQAIFGQKTVNIDWAYEGTNITEAATYINSSVNSMIGTYQNCKNIKRVYWNTQLNYRNFWYEDYYGYSHSSLVNTYAGSGILIADFPIQQINENAVFIGYGINLFSDCSNLYKINWYNGTERDITSCSLNLYNCKNLKNIDFPPEKNYLYINFDNCGIENINFYNLSYSRYAISISFKNCNKLKILPEINEINSILKKSKGSFRLTCYNCDNLQYSYFTGKELTVLSCTSMFMNCYNLKHVEKIENAYDMSYAYSNCFKLENVDFGNNLEVGTVSGLRETCYNCYSLINCTLPSSVVKDKNNFYLGLDMTKCFYNCTNLVRINGNLDLFITHQDKKEIFYNCQNLVYVPINFSTDWNLTKSYSGTNQISWYYTFYNCSNLINAPFFILNGTYNNQSFYSTFKGCHNLKSIVIGNDITNYDVVSANIYLEYTFADCYNLSDFGILNNISNLVTNCPYAFCNCYQITQAFIMDNTKELYWTYKNCINLISGTCGSNVISMYGTYYNCSKLQGNLYINSNNVQHFNSCFYNRNNQNQLNIYVYSNTVSNAALYNNNLYANYTNGAKNYWNIWSNGLGYSDETNNVYVYYLDKI